MPEKISRDICLIEYRNFPLWEVDEKTDKEYSFYPKIHSHYWLKLDSSSDKSLTKKLSIELTKLFEAIGIRELIFFSAHNAQWISKHTSQRDDTAALKKAITYFKDNKLSGKFNGAIKIFKPEFLTFFEHIHTLTVCDSGFYHNHFLDNNQQILGYIHYSGEIRFDILDKEMNEKFLKEIKNTHFLDIGKAHTNEL